MGNIKFPFVCFNVKYVYIFKFFNILEYNMV